MYYYIQVTISLFSKLLFQGSIKQYLRLTFSTFLQINFGKFTMFSHITNCSFAWIKKHWNNCLNWFCSRLTNIFSTQETQIDSVWFYRLMGSCNYLIIIAIEGASIWRLSPTFTYDAENQSNEMKLGILYRSWFKLNPYF